MPKYIFRIDDVCEQMPKSQYGRLLEIFGRHGVRAVHGLVPDNKHPLLVDKDGYTSSEMKKLIRQLHDQGHTIALHGLTHIYDRGHSEFRGHSYQEQYRRLNQGKEILKSEYGIEPRVFIAPAHQSDHITDRCLHELGFECNYDGRGISPYMGNGLIRIPCNLWENFMRFPWGINTINLHPQMLSNEQLDKIEAFICKNRKQIVDYEYIKSYVEKKPGRTLGDLAGCLFLIPKMADQIKRAMKIGEYKKGVNQRAID